MTSAIQVAIRNQIQASIVVKQVVLENQQIITNAIYFFRLYLRHITK